MQYRPDIAIVGGGPGGLTLARILLTRGIRPVVFELEEHSQARPQGGTLDLHPESGQLALHHAGLGDAFQGIARYDDQESRICDKHGALLFEETDASTGDRPEVDRTELRRILLKSLPEGVVRWAHKVTRVDPSGDGRYAVTCENGSHGTFDLVVGADGAWSRVRPLVSAAKPTYSGVTFVELGIDDIDVNEPALAKLVGRGTLFALGEARGLIAQRNGHSHVRVYAAFREPESWMTGGALDLSSLDRARATLMAQFPGWAPSILQLIERCGEGIVARAIHALPAGHRWPNRPGVTLLGDAAHVMSPFSGEGVNMAMLDAADLALHLATEPDWKSAVQSYEGVMFHRAGEAAAEAAQGLESAFSADAPQPIVAQMRQRSGRTP